MLVTSALLVVLAQSPQVECLSAYGMTRCARTPQGRCLAAYGQVVCGDPSPAAWRQGAPQLVECLAAYSSIACGYNCLAAYGQVKCADLPEARCVAAYGEVTCPTAAPRWGGGRGGGWRRPPSAEPATCQSAYGKTACGYNCVAAYGQLKCASHPSGRCVAAYGEVTCSN